MKAFMAVVLLVTLSSCSSLIVPGEGKAMGGASEAEAVIVRSARLTGDGWNRYRKVEVSYDGEWTGIVKRLQPDLVDGEFRKSSEEIYEPGKNLVRQWHRGPGGRKMVLRTPGAIEVEYEAPDGREADKNLRDAAALVADAYTVFLFGTSWLKEHAEDLSLLEPREFSGEICDLVQGRVRPGFGFSEEDRFIAWVGRESGWLRRFQFTIDGLESTRGADVEVSFFDHWRAADGSVWPGRFVEWVERPVKVKAHEWSMMGLKLDGKREEGLGDLSDNSP